MPKSKRTDRLASLGINFEHGPHGALVFYDGKGETVYAYLPKGRYVDVNDATRLAMTWKTNKRVLTTKQVLTILDSPLSSK